jgi:hypothetical protein
LFLHRKRPTGDMLAAARVIVTLAPPSMRRATGRCETASGRHFSQEFGFL